MLFVDSDPFLIENVYFYIIFNSIHDDMIN